MAREEYDRLGIARAPRRPNPRAPAQPGDRRYTPREMERNRISTGTGTGMNAYVMRGKQPLPEFGNVLPGEEIILEADGIWYNLSQVEFTLFGPTGRAAPSRAVVLDVFSDVNPFTGKASARVTAPLIEGEYWAQGKIASIFGAQQSPAFHFNITKAASKPPEIPSSPLDIFKPAELNKTLKWIAIGAGTLAILVAVIKFLPSGKVKGESR